MSMFEEEELRILEFLKRPYVDGEARVYANDGTYLGKVTTNQHDLESMFVLHGPYGGRYSSSSLRNTIGLYGSTYGAESAYNPACPTPPRVVYRGDTIAHLTKNPFIHRHLDPDRLYAAFGTSREA